jgi:hypothetical protein
MRGKGERADTVLDATSFDQARCRPDARQVGARAPAAIGVTTPGGQASSLQASLPRRDDSPRRDQSQWLVPRTGSHLPPRADRRVLGHRHGGLT